MGLTLAWLVLVARAARIASTPSVLMFLNRVMHYTTRCASQTYHKQAASQLLTESTNWKSLSPVTNCANYCGKGGLPMHQTTRQQRTQQCCVYNSNTTMLYSQSSAAPTVLSYSMCWGCNGRFVMGLCSLLHLRYDPWKASSTTIMIVFIGSLIFEFRLLLTGQARSLWPGKGIWSQTPRLKTNQLPQTTNKTTPLQYTPHHTICSKKLLAYLVC